MKRIMIVILAVSTFLPLLAAPASCDTTSLGPTLLKTFAKPECLAKYGWLIAK